MKEIYMLKITIYSQYLLARFSPSSVTNRFLIAAYAMLNHILNALYGYPFSLNSPPFLDLNLYIHALPQPLLLPIRRKKMV